MVKEYDTFTSASCIAGIKFQQVQHQGLGELRYLPERRGVVGSWTFENDATAPGRHLDVGPYMSPTPGLLPVSTACSDNEQGELISRFLSFELGEKKQKLPTT